MITIMFSSTKCQPYELQICNHQRIVNLWYGVPLFLDILTSLGICMQNTTASFSWGVQHHFFNYMPRKLSMILCKLFLISKPWHSFYKLNACLHEKSCKFLCYHSITRLNFLPQFKCDTFVISIRIKTICPH